MKEPCVKVLMTGGGGTSRQLLVPVSPRVPWRILATNSSFYTKFSKATSSTCCTDWPRDWDRSPEGWEGGQPRL